MNHPPELKTKFLELRARGMSYSHIAEGIGVSKPTLIQWGKAMAEEIADLQAAERELVREKLLGNFEQWLGRQVHHFTRLDEEFGRREFKYSPTESVFRMLMASRKLLDRYFFEDDSPSRRRTSDGRAPSSPLPQTSPSSSPSSKIPSETKSNETERFAKNDSPRSRNTNDLQQPASQSFDFPVQGRAAAPPAAAHNHNRNRNCPEPEGGTPATHSPTSQELGVVKSTLDCWEDERADEAPALAATEISNLQSEVPDPSLLPSLEVPSETKSNETERFAKNDSPRSRNINDLQQPASQSFDFPAQGRAAAPSAAAHNHNHNRNRPEPEGGTPRRPSQSESENRKSEMALNPQPPTLNQTQNPAKIRPFTSQNSGGHNSNLSQEGRDAVSAPRRIDRAIAGSSNAINTTDDRNHHQQLR